MRDFLLLGVLLELNVIGLLFILFLLLLVVNELLWRPKIRHMRKRRDSL